LRKRVSALLVVVRGSGVAASAALAASAIQTAASTGTTRARVGRA
jgi:hypothetical protein